MLRILHQPLSRDSALNREPVSMSDDEEVAQGMLEMFIELREGTYFADQTNRCSKVGVIVFRCR